MAPTVLGIDISKKKFHAALMRENGKTKPKVFSNDPEGFNDLLKWLSRHHVNRIHACMEATSIYGEALAEFLYEAGHIVSVVNPARIKGFAIMRTTPHQNRQGRCSVDCPILCCHQATGKGFRCLQKLNNYRLF